VPDEDGFYDRRQIVEVLYGSIYTERLKTQKELTRRLALQNFATTAAMLNRAGRRPARYGLLAFSTDEAASCSAPNTRDLAVIRRRADGAPSFCRRGSVQNGAVFSVDVE
jgi:hypothetical protein